MLFWEAAKPAQILHLEEFTQCSLQHPYKGYQMIIAGVIGATLPAIVVFVIWQVTLYMKIKRHFSSVKDSASRK